MQNLLNQFIQDYQKQQQRRDQHRELLDKLSEEHPIYCILSLLVVTIISFYIKNLFSSFINRIKNLDFTDLRTIFLCLLSISILNDIVYLLFN